jgi:hypothetical protein
MHNSKIKDVYHAYFRFNNKRTFSTDLPSELCITESASCSVFVDKTRRYDNQIIIHEMCNPEILQGYLNLYRTDYLPEISVDPVANSNELQSWLLSHGLVHIFEHEFLQLQISNFVALEKLPDSIVVERWGKNEADDFLALLKTSGVECPSETWSKKRALYCTDTFRCYVTKVNGEPCAWATSFIEGDHAILANAYTQKGYRTKGCQKALLGARIEDAISIGVKVLLTDVMANSISSKNCKSLGFSSVGIRNVWGKD